MFDERFFKSPEPEEDPLKNMLKVEIPKKGIFYLFNDLFKYQKHSDNDERDGGGSVWLVKEKHALKLKEEGIDAVLSEHSNGAGLFIVLQERTPPEHGFVIDFYNNPSFGHDYDIFEQPAEATGILDVLAKADKTNTSLGSIRDMIQGAVRTKVASLEHDLENIENESLVISCVFFHDAQDPQALVENVFDGFQYSLVLNDRGAPQQTEVKITLPLSQFLND